MRTADLLTERYTRAEGLTESKKTTKHYLYYH